VKTLEELFTIIASSGFFNFSISLSSKGKSLSSVAGLEDNGVL